jgi:hypothetical protein
VTNPPLPFIQMKLFWEHYWQFILGSVFFGVGVLGVANGDHVFGGLQIFLGVCLLYNGYADRRTRISSEGSIPADDHIPEKPT